MQEPGAARPDCTHVLLNTGHMRIRRAAASDMAHSAACSSSDSQSSPTRRPNAETPHQLLSLPVSEKPLTLFYIICTLPVVDLSRKFWSGENFGPGDQNSRKIWSAGLLFSENIGPRME